MAIENRLPGNSRGANSEKTTQSRPVVTKVISGTAHEREMSLGRKFKKAFVPQSPQEIFEYVLFDVAVPTLKGLVLDIFFQGLERTLYGDERPGRSYSTSYWSRREPTSYSSMYREARPSRGSRRETARREPEPADSRDADSIVLPDRGEAELVLDQINDRLESSGVFTMAELLEMVGISPNPQDSKYGWTDIRGAQVIRVRGGYSLDLPRIEYLN